MGNVESVDQSSKLDHEKKSEKQSKIQQVSHFLKHSQGTFATTIIGKNTNKN